MFVIDKNGDWVFLPRGVCFADKEGEEEGGGEGGEEIDGGEEGSEDAGNSYIASVEAIEDEKVREFAGKFTSIQDFAKNGLDLRQKISGMVTVPGKDASDEDRAKFHKALGVPETHDAYEIAVPENYEITDTDTAFHAKVKEAAHKQGISQAQLAALNEVFNEHTTAALEGLETDMATAIETRTTALKKEWGDDYDSNIAVSKRALRTFADDDFTAWLEAGKIDGVPAGDHPFMAKLLANVGKRLGEDTLADGQLGAEAAADLETEHARLSAQIVAASNKGDRLEAQRLQKERDKINHRLAGKTAVAQ